MVCPVLYNYFQNDLFIVESRTWSAYPMAVTKKVMPAALNQFYQRDDVEEGQMG
jgi:hypothetical protein